jgi:parvulin-like peptidyl-prolyl isomerase
VLIGAVLFGVYEWRNRAVPGGAGAGQVHISEADVKWLKETWSKQWQREPDNGELRGLVTEYLKEELLAREAREMGLDQDDIYVRRRLAQKVEFLVQDSSRLAQPSEEDLQKFYAAHPERFTDDERVSFTHIYFNSEHRADLASALARLKAGANPAELGDRLLVDPKFEGADPQAVSGHFGAEFSRAVFALPPGEWSGPVASGYGLHLVRVSETKPAQVRAFREVREQVLQRWHDARQREDNEKYFASLLKKYDVVLDENVKLMVGPLTLEGSLQ